MSDDNKKDGKKRLKELVSGTSGKIGKLILSVLQLISKTIKLLLWNPITVGLAMLFIGARLHETGQLAGKFQKDLRGATVRISGKCLTANKEPRVPTLAEDQVKITYIDGERLQAVVRQTREIVDCKLSEVAIDTLPLLAYLGTDMTQIPELTAHISNRKGLPAFKALEKKTLVMSGSCQDTKGNELPAFTDEVIDVTAVDAIEDSQELFMLSGIKKVDKLAIKCVSSNIKYSEFTPVKEVASKGNLNESQTKSYVGEILVVTGTCFPDERTKVNKTKKYLFYKFANSKIQILEHDLASDGSINRLVGTVLDEEFRGDAVYCDKVKFPFIYKTFDDESMNLDKGISSESQAEETPATETATEVQN